MGIKPSLGTRLFRHVLLPLVIIWALGAAVTLGISNYFVGQAFDRALLDDAYSAANRVTRDGELPVIRLSPAEMDTLLFDQTEHVYFSLMAADGTFVAGHRGLPVPPNATRHAPETAPAFSDLFFEGQALRGVTLHKTQPVPFILVMTQTTTSRGKLLERLVVYSLLPQGLLLIGLAWWFRRAIRSDLAAFSALQSDLEKREVRDLSPLAFTAETSDVQQVGDAVNALLVRVGEGVSALREFTGNVAHELRTPLAGIRALTTYGLRHGEPAVWRKSLQDIAKSEERASHLVEQLLALAFADEARINLSFEKIRLDNTVRGVVLGFVSRADALGADLGAQGLDVPVEVWGHTVLVEGILNNLLDNALRYGRAPENLQHLVTVKLQALDDGVVLLRVTDNGPGMDSAQTIDVQARWQQGAAGRQLGEGTGLGLAIVARYAQLMGARVTLGRPSGEDGQSVTIYFPALDKTL